MLEEDDVGCKLSAGDPENATFALKYALSQLDIGG